MNDHGRYNTDKSGPRTRGIVAALAVLICLAPVLAPAQQQQDPDRLPAGALPTQALILGDPNQDGFSINIEFVEVDIRDVVLFFGQLTGINMVLDPGVSGPVTTQLFDVPWDTALLTILDSHDLGWQVQRNILRITTVQKLADAAEAQVRLMDQERLAQPLETEQLEFSNGDPIANLTTVAFFASLGGFDLGDPTAPTVRSATATTFNGIAQVLYRSASSGNATITAAVGTVSSSAAVTVEPDPEQGAIQLFFLVDGQQLTTTSGAASVASPFVRELTAILTDPETGTFRQGAQVRFRIIRDSTLGSGVGAAKFVGSPTSFTDQFGKAVAKLSVTGVGNVTVVAEMLDSQTGEVACTSNQVIATTTAALLAQLTFSDGVSTSFTAAAPYTEGITVTVTDTSLAAVPGVTVRFSITLDSTTAGASLSSSLSVTDANGQATSALTVPDDAGGAGSLVTILAEVIDGNNNVLATSNTVVAIGS